MSEYITTKQAAEILDISPQSVNRLIRNGKIKGEWFGHIRQVDRESVLAYLETIKGKARNDPTRGKVRNDESNQES